MNVPRSIEGLGLSLATVVLMVAFAIGTLLIVFSFHSILTVIYALSTWAGIPFLVLLAWPIWAGIPAVLLVRLLKYISRPLSS